jgi:uncharacterized protein YndB with AHSA1/START domain
MKNTGKLKVTAAGEREIMMVRALNAPRARVFDAFTRPELIKRWLSGPPGWSMVVCEVDLKVGGTFRYEWRHDDGREMGMGGVYREIVAPERIVSTEKFDEAWYPGEAIGTVALSERDGVTTVTQTILYDSKQTRDAVLKSPMESGVAYGYDQMEAMLAGEPVA